MKKLIITIGIVFTLGVTCFGQEETKPRSAGNGDVGMQFDSAFEIEGKLQNTLDVQKAQVGDEVIIKTTRAVKNGGKTVVPKGSKLIGRVTEVQKRSKEDNFSRLGLVFDRLEGGNLNSDISGSIVSITRIAAAGGVNDSVDLFGSSETSARSSRSSSGGGGLLGGAGSAGGLVGGVTNTVGSTVNSSLQTVGGVTGAVDRTVGSTTGVLGRTVNGLQISNSATGSVESGTTLSATGRNLRVEKGATVNLQVAGKTNGQ